MDGQSLIQRKSSSSKDIEMEKIYLMKGTKSFEYYPQDNARECATGGLKLHHELLDYLNMNGFRPAALDEEGDVRIFELIDHEFYMGTLFFPQLTSRGALPHPLITNFAKAAQKYREKQFLANEAIAL